MNSSPEPKAPTKAKPKSKKRKQKKSALITTSNEQPSQFFKKLSTTDILQANYKQDWIDRVDFEMCDAAKAIDKYVDAEGKDCTHIYSYNKVMSVEDTENISDILNRTNYRILAWYFDP